MNDITFTTNKDQLEVTTSRVFKASAERLWQAVTDPEQIPQWWGPGTNKTSIEKNELRVGGAWRFVQTPDDGSTHAFRGEYQEIDEPRKIVRTFEYEPMAGHVLTETLLLEPQADGTTKLTTVAHYANLGDMEGMLSMGMEGGQRESFERLGGLVEAA